MITAHVISTDDGRVKTDFGTWEFLALPSIGEAIGLWNPSTDLPASGRIVSIVHNPRGIMREQPSVLIIITPDQPGL